MLVLRIIPEQLTVKAQEPLILTCLYKMVASREAAIFNNCQCDQMQNCERDCEAIYSSLSACSFKQPMVNNPYLWQKKDDDRDPYELEEKKVEDQPKISSKMQVNICTAVVAVRQAVVVF